MSIPLESPALCRLRAVLIAALLAAAAACQSETATSKKPAVPSVPQAAAALLPLSRHIMVDQFGYLPSELKVAVIRNPHVGYDAADAFAPGATYEVRRADDGQVVYAGMPVAWNKGTVEPSSGDSGWWFDFSAVAAPGVYFIADAQRGVRSPTFGIDSHVYRNVLKAAMRMYFYQRSGFAKHPPYAEDCWADEPAYIGDHQDTEARDVTDRANAAKVRDVSGGWFDAGDTDKYVTFAVSAVHQLLTAYEEHPAVFTDDFGIPESGNGIPDVLDEVKWETDWLKKMQYRDGSAALKVGNTQVAFASPPSTDSSPRFYVPSCTSATIAVAGMFAHAANVYKQIPALAGEATELRQRAIGAWHNFHSKPHELHCDTGIVRAANADWDAARQDAAAVVAAVYLFALTGNDIYGDYVKAHYSVLRPYRDMGWSRYEAEQGDALLFYTRIANADAELRGKILADKRGDASSQNGVYRFEPDSDLYRAFMHEQQYHWGSNQIRANYGNTNLDVVAYELGLPDTSSYEIRALETLHYFHGVNPFGMVYLSNMYAYGASNSVNEIFHSAYGRYANKIDRKLDRLSSKLRLNRVGGLRQWLDFKSKWNDAVTSECGPPPGYVPGGANKDAEANGVPAALSPPAGQPPQKSYKDWNVEWPDASWAITEPAIYYQAAYVKLLSAFAQ